MRSKILIFIFTIAPILFMSLYAQEPHELSKQACIEDIKDFSPYWIKDSLCNNGFRALITYTPFFSNCSLIGKKWEDWKKYFGKATFTFTNEEYIEYRYKMLEGDYGGPGQTYLSIHVSKEGLITYFKQWTVDG